MYRLYIIHYMVHTYRAGLGRSGRSPTRFRYFRYRSVSVFRYSKICFFQWGAAAPHTPRVGGCCPPHPPRIMRGSAPQTPRKKSVRSVRYRNRYNRYSCKTRIEAKPGYHKSLSALGRKACSSSRKQAILDSQSTNPRWT